MAVTRAQKEVTIAEIKDLLSQSKMTVIADYEGLPVAQFQALRSQMEAAGIVVKVVKNRLVLKALEDLGLRDKQLSLSGMMVYVFSPEDEVKGAQIIKSFVKSSKAPLEFVGAITDSGQFMGKAEVTQLSGLPSKTELIATIIYSLQAPLNTVRTTLSSGLPSLLANIESSKS